MPLNPCCADPANLGIESVVLGLTTRICRVCDSRHYEVTVDPGPMNASIAGLKEG